MKELIKNHWQVLLIILSGVGMFFVYSWFPASASRDLYICDASETQAQKAGNQVLQSNSEKYCESYGSAENIYKFNSPDETLNFFFTLRQAQGKPMFYEEPLEGIGNNLIRPRSVNVVGDKVLPGSFMGMYFIYGGLGRLGGLIGLEEVNVLFYLTAFFAVLGIVFFYLLLSLIFSKNIALISGLLAYTIPSWLYFASRSFYHNVLFISLLIIGVYLLLRALDIRTKFSQKTGDRRQETEEKTLTEFKTSGYKLRITRYLLFSLAGVFIGGSLITRTSEIGWVFLLVVLIFLFNWRKFRIQTHPLRHQTREDSISENPFTNQCRSIIWHYWLGAALFGVFLTTAFIPVFVTNIKLYGVPLSIGYGTGLAGDVTGLLSQPGLMFKLLISPFGWHPRHIALNGYNYLIKFFWQFSLPAAVGMLLWLLSSLKFSLNKNINNKPAADTQINADVTPINADPVKSSDVKSESNGAGRKKQVGYLAILLAITIYLLVYYGSWLISDRIDLQAVSIGTSFVRYWLPIYLGMLPFVAMVINSIINLLRFRVWPKPIIAALLILLLAWSGVRLAYFDTDESLTVIRDNVRESQTKLLKIRQIVPEEAIVVLGFKQADKIFFPEYKRIISELVVPFDYESVVLLANQADLYYYHFTDPDDVVTISSRDFESYGIKINPETGQNIYGREWLYQMEVVESIEEN
jgi:hypothetical protein